MEPEVVILDEPFTSLDLDGVVTVLREIVKLAERGQTIIVITHEVEKVLAHATRLVIMDHGSIAEDGSPEELLARIGRYGVHVSSTSPGCIASMTWLK